MRPKRRGCMKAPVKPKPTSLRGRPSVLSRRSSGECNVSTALATILASIRVQDEAIVRAQLLAKIRISEGPHAGSTSARTWVATAAFVGDQRRVGAYHRHFGCSQGGIQRKAAADNHQ